MGRTSHYERAHARILLWVEHGALCPLDDADVIYEYLTEAVEKDNEYRGLGVRRRPFSLDDWPRQQHNTFFRMERDEIYKLMEELRFPQGDRG